MRGKPAKILPEEIGLRVVDEDRLAAPGGRAARADLRADGNAIDQAAIGGWQIGRGAVGETYTFVIQQQHRSFDIGKLIFNHQYQRLEDHLERLALGDHFQQFGLTAAQMLLALALSDIARNADQADHLTVTVAQR